MFGDYCVMIFFLGEVIIALWLFYCFCGVYVDSFHGVFLFGRVFVLYE